MSRTSKEGCKNEREMPTISCVCNMLDMRKRGAAILRALQESNDLEEQRDFI